MRLTAIAVCSLTRTPVGVYSHIKDQDIFPASLPAKSGKKTNVGHTVFVFITWNGALSFKLSSSTTIEMI